MAAFEFLGTVSQTAPLWTWAIRNLASRLPAEFLEHPMNLHRIGDVLVWRGEGGQQVVAALESLSESQAQIEAAVHNIEAVQLTAASSLGVLHNLSLATLGITSLSAVYMGWRLGALHRRMDELRRDISDLESHIEFQDRAHLENSLQFFSDYEAKRPGKERDSDLERAHAEARLAASVYGNLALAEATQQKRLPVLSHWTRCYLLALTTELHAMILREDHDQAIVRIERDEQARLKRIAQVVFSDTVGKSPEAYLDPGLRAEWVTLELMTEIYRQAQQAGAASDTQIKDATELFEHLRTRIYEARRGFRGFFSPKADTAVRLLRELRMLMACLEDTNRIESLRLLLRESTERHFSIRDLSRQIQCWRQERRDEVRAECRGPLFAYSW